MINEFFAYNSLDFVALSLLAPDGTNVRLFDTNEDIDGYSLYLTRFDDSAFNHLSEGVPPYTGSFLPDEPLSTFNGAWTTGTWTLVIYDAGNRGGCR